jgi:hypothetical protein
MVNSIVKMMQVLSIALLSFDTYWLDLLGVVKGCWYFIPFLTKDARCDRFDNGSIPVSSSRSQGVIKLSRFIGDLNRHHWDLW